MVFSSLTFICVFLPVVFILYGIIPSLKARNVLLMLASLVFYAYGEPVYILLMLGSSFLNYIFALLVEKGDPRRRKHFLFLAVALNLLLLCIFKYADMLVDTCNHLFSSRLPQPEIVLPIGISFFTFQALSYVIDVYRGQVRAQKNYIYVQLYIAFFPQLIAGPIVRYRDIEQEIQERSRDLELISRGLRRFIVGLSKKVLIANAMGQVADQIFTAPADHMSTPAAWVGAIAYLFQIYYDFSGYSDMAIGLGWMFGFHFKENFRYPYAAFSVQEFWRRWHISLSSWFKEYLYIPLGGNRKGRGRTVLNRMIVFFLTGLWHGANWTFVLWGLFHGLFLLFEEYFPLIRKIPRWLGRIYTLLVVCVGFVMFRADSARQGFEMIGRMFSGFSVNEIAASFLLQQLTPWFLIMLAAAILGCGPLRRFAEQISAMETSSAAIPNRKARVIEAMLSAGSFCLLVWCILRLSASAYNPFIYFKF